jgi:hypothetical protein
MERRKFTPEEIEKIVESMNSISRAEISPFFYTRLQAKIDNASPPAVSVWQVMMKPAVSLATLSLLLILNIAAIRYYTKASKQPVSETTSPIQKFADEYGLGTNSVYTDKTTK